MIRQDQLEAVRSTLSELAKAQVTAAICLSQLQDLVATDIGLVGESDQIPRVDDTKFCVVWQGRVCYLGHTKSFRLFAHLLRRADHYVGHDHLLRDVWHGDMRSSDTIRSAVRELRGKLCRADMAVLAQSIKGEGQHYGLILPKR